MSADVEFDFDAIRQQAEAAAKDFLENRYEAYLENVKRVEALPENQSGADKTWVEEACEQHRQLFIGADCFGTAVCGHDH